MAGEEITWIDSKNQRMIDLATALDSFKQASDILKSIRKASDAYQAVKAASSATDSVSNNGAKPSSWMKGD